MRKTLLVGAVALVLSGCAGGDPGVRVSTGEARRDASTSTTAPAEPGTTGPSLLTTTSVPTSPTVPPTGGSPSSATGRR